MYETSDHFMLEKTEQLVRPGYSSIDVDSCYKAIQLPQWFLSDWSPNLELQLITDLADLKGYASLAQPPITPRAMGSVSILIGHC